MKSKVFIWICENCSPGNRYKKHLNCVAPDFRIGEADERQKWQDYS